MPSKKPYFPNNIDAVMETEYDPVDVDVVMDNSLHLWDIPSSVAVIMRATNKKTGKIEEYSYSSVYHAKKKIQKLMMSGNYDLLLADDESISLVTSAMVQEALLKADDEDEDEEDED
ncbi:hypothetical protein N8654_03220 [Synechococcus sp. AH-601-B19]|nr:hypothetical protein [Synechococcus sp. AH-601-B19]